MPENENNDVMNDDIANLPEGDADTEGAEGSEGNAGDGEGNMEGGDGEGENGTEGTDGLEDGESAGDEDLATDGDMMGGDMGDIGTETGVKDPILSNIPFVSITIGAALVVGIVLGILLGKKRIKKGFDLYEN